LSRLWDKGEALDDAVARLTVGRDPELDVRLVPYDALASAAHGKMLGKVGILADEELTDLLRELERIADAARQGHFAIDPAEEDGHTAIENRLTSRLGDAGRKIHTGRSRNDQVIAALRLWGREALLDFTERLLTVIEALSELATSHTETSIPGYTHTRQAMTTTLGHYFAAFAESLLDHLPWIETAWSHLNRSPLGSASGYGVALPLDREYVAELLGFDSVQVNTLAVQNDRGRTEAMVLGVASAALTDLGRLARDLIHYSGKEMGFVRLGAETTTGSSIMPQKRNPDALEIIRAAAVRCRHLVAQIADIHGGLGAGYHRDLQLTKEPFLEGMVLATDCFTAMAAVLAGLEVDVERCRAAVEPSTAATDAVYSKVARGTPFRDAYREVGENPTGAYGGDAAESWRDRAHRGAPGATSESDLTERRKAGEDWRGKRSRGILAVWDRFGRQ
jgi:argininosuccinate lyase